LQQQGRFARGTSPCVIMRTGPSANSEEKNEHRVVSSAAQRVDQSRCRADLRAQAVRACASGRDGRCRHRRHGCGQNVWVGPVATPSPWENSANWSSGSVPNGDVAFINNGGIAQMTTYNGEILALQLGSTVGSTGSMIQDGGSLKLTQVLVLGSASDPAPTAGGSGTYTMNNGTLLDTDNFVGSKGFGTFNMNGGTLISTGHMRLGDDEGSRGVLNQTGGAITLPGFLLVGHFSPAGSSNITTGTYNMSGGTMTVANLNLGQHPQARGEVHQTGGWVQNTANTVIGETSRQANLYDLSGGMLRVAGGPGGGTVFVARPMASASSASAAPATPRWTGTSSSAAAWAASALSARSTYPAEP